MKIKNVTKQWGHADFNAMMECESCGNVQELNSGYNDLRFHITVVPTIKCISCGESRISIGVKTPIYAMKVNEETTLVEAFDNGEVWVNNEFVYTNKEFTDKIISAQIK